MVSNILCVNAPGCQVDPYKHERVRQKIKSCQGGVGEEGYIVGVGLVYESLFELGKSRSTVNQSPGITIT